MISSSSIEEQVDIAACSRRDPHYIQTGGRVDKQIDGKLDRQVAHNTRTGTIDLGIQFDVQTSSN